MDQTKMTTAEVEVLLRLLADWERDELALLMRELWAAWAGWTSGQFRGGCDWNTVLVSGTD